MKAYESQSLVEASEWFALLASENSSEKVRQDWKNWLNANVENANAWKKIEAVNHQFLNVTNELGFEVIKLPNPKRRMALKQLAIVGASGFLGVYAYREQPWVSLLADASTTVGQRQNMQLADGTQLDLNTNSIVNIHYSEKLRLIELIQGEIYIQTATDALRRPFKVKTKNGTITALGTTFGVRIENDIHHVYLNQGLLEIVPQNNPSIRHLVYPGQTAQLNHTQITHNETSRAGNTAWLKGKLVVFEQPLKEVIKELNRYHVGVLRCHPNVSELKITGVLPIDNTTEALRLLKQSFPLKTETFTTYWVTISGI